MSYESDKKKPKKVHVDIDTSKASTMKLGYIKTQIFMKVYKEEL